MNKKLKLFAVLLGLAVVVYSCDKEEEKDTSTPPEIYEFTAGTHDHSCDTVSLGGEIIVDFKARSMNDGRLEAYHIEIHDHPASGDPADEYLIIDELFDNDITFNGTKNATVHKHIAVPADAPTGEYHVEVIVFDEYGNTTDADTHVYVIE